MAIEPFERLAGEKAENAIDVQQASKLVKRGSNPDEVALTTEDEDTVLGVVTSSRGAGERVQVLEEGYFELIADGTISDGDRLVPSDSTNGAVKASDDLTKTHVGYARKAASDGDIFLGFVQLESQVPRKLTTIDTGSEGDGVADAFDVDFQQNYERADRWLVEVYDDNLDPSSNVQISSQGSETLVSASGQDAVIFDLAGDGSATLRFLDSSGSLSATVRVVCMPLNSDGVTEQFSLTYS